MLLGGPKYRGGGHGCFVKGPKLSNFFQVAASLKQRAWGALCSVFHTKLLFLIDFFRGGGGSPPPPGVIPPEQQKFE